MTPITSLATSRLLVEAFAARELELPLSLNPAEPGDVMDAKGRHVFVIDLNRERSDIEATEIAGLIVLAVNRCAGFPFPVLQSSESQ
ncbi:hypothetical protein ATY81_12355 [Rhizobium sp. R72]|uniref:hypothetical protein n=1 Tax=unclassified Rhizobium TaxID=2613769 RepID=UPI000B531C86|nr:MULTISPECIES: hypothetical protein [unclassified Rhizobium]OWV94237.1 hypothetical protein ATY81_12355 [Rhizobium sp. R72]OWV94507.1 hypothetical protein ATY80_12355 [Rhizobium sp. R711]